MAGRARQRGNGNGGAENKLSLFARELRAQREAAGLTQEELAKLMGYSTSVIAKLETGRAFPLPEHARLADAAFKTPGTFERSREGMLNGAYESWFRVYVDLEQCATVIRSWQPLVVDGLLQTEAYARAMLRAGRPGDSDDEIDRLVTARLARQAVLDREDPLPPMLYVILAEAVLREPVGSAAIMREQLGHLVDAARSPRITVQVVPRSAGAHPGKLGPFVVASFENSPDAAYLDNALTGQVTERRKDVARVALLYDTLRGEALSPGASVDLIVKAMEEWT